MATEFVDEAPPETVAEAVVESVEPKMKGGPEVMAAVDMVLLAWGLLVMRLPEEVAVALALVRAATTGVVELPPQLMLGVVVATVLTLPDGVAVPTVE